MKTYGKKAASSESKRHFHAPKCNGLDAEPRTTDPNKKGRGQLPTSLTANALLQLEYGNCRSNRQNEQRSFD